MDIENYEIFSNLRTERTTRELSLRNPIQHNKHLMKNLNFASLALFCGLLNTKRPDRFRKLARSE